MISLAIGEIYPGGGLNVRSIACRDLGHFDKPKLLNPCTTAAVRPLLSHMYGIPDGDDRLIVLELAVLEYRQNSQPNDGNPGGHSPFEMQTADPPVTEVVRSFEHHAAEFQRLSARLSRSELSEMQPGDDTRSQAKNFHWNAIEFFLKMTDDFEMTSERMKLLIHCFDPPPEDEMDDVMQLQDEVFGLASRDPWLIRCEHYYELLQRRADVRPEDLTEFHDKCIPEFFKSGERDCLIEAIKKAENEFLNQDSEQAALLCRQAENNDTDRAERRRLASRALEIDPKCVHAHYLIGSENKGIAFRSHTMSLMLSEKGRKNSEKALQWFNKAIRLMEEKHPNVQDPGGAPWEEFTFRPYLKTLFAKAELLSKSGRAAEALDVAKKSLEISPADHLGVRRRAVEYAGMSDPINIEFLRHLIAISQLGRGEECSTSDTLWLHVFLGFYDGIPQPELEQRLKQALNNQPWFYKYLLNEEDRNAMHANPEAGEGAAFGSKEEGLMTMLRGCGLWFLNNGSRPMLWLQGVRQRTSGVPAREVLEAVLAETDIIIVFRDENGAQVECRTTTRIGLIPLCDRRRPLDEALGQHDLLIYDKTIGVNKWRRIDFRKISEVPFFDLFRTIEREDYALLDSRNRDLQDAGRRELAEHQDRRAAGRQATDLRRYREFVAGEAYATYRELEEEFLAQLEPRSAGPTEEAALSRDERFWILSDRTHESMLRYEEILREENPTLLGDFQVLQVRIDSLRTGDAEAPVEESADDVADSGAESSVVGEAGVVDVSQASAGDSGEAVQIDAVDSSRMGHIASEDRDISEVAVGPAPPDPVVPSSAPKKSSTCPDCGEKMVKCAMKRHRTRFCSYRKVECPLKCDTKVCARRLEDHIVNHCECRPVSCEACGDGVQQWAMKEHLSEKCRLRRISCPNEGCRWTGAFEDYSKEHELVCGYEPTECQWCLKQLLQHQMPSHQCQLVLAEEDECVVCLRSFGDLFSEDSVLPAILLKGNQPVCSCKTPVACVTCATKWREGVVSNPGDASTCPVCRCKYDGVAALAQHLLVQQHNRATVAAPPVGLKPEDPLGTTTFLSPISVRFTHDTVKKKFRDFKLGGQWREDPSILDSIRECMQSEKSHNLPRTLDCLDVCWGPASDDRPGDLYLAGTGNRRLTMWRLLALYRPHVWGCIKVRLVDRAHPRVQFDKKCTTECKGRWIEVRDGGAEDKIVVGESIDGDADWEEDRFGRDPGVRWPEAVAILQRETSRSSKGGS